MPYCISDFSGSLALFLRDKNRSAQRSANFPPLEKAHSYKGELTFVDHANRRGSLRIDGDGRFRFAAPSPFALLPYGLVRYHGSPADLRDIPLGTVMYAKAFLPPDPKISSVPVLPLDNREKKYGYAGTGVAPAENHIFLFEDEPSYCKRLGLVWKLQGNQSQGRPRDTNCPKGVKIRKWRCP